MLVSLLFLLGQLLPGLFDVLVLMLPLFANNFGNFRIRELRVVSRYL